MDKNHNYILALKNIISIKWLDHTGGLTTTETKNNFVINNTVKFGQLWYKLFTG